MKLYFVENGYVGSSSVFWAVIAENETEACDITKNKILEDDGVVSFYGENYYNNLSAYEIFNDVSYKQTSDQLGGD